MDQLEVLVDVQDEEQEFTPYINIEHLKNIKEISQVFLKVNNYDISEEPDVSDLTEEQFISFVKGNTNETLVTKFKDMFEENFRSIMSNIYKHKDSDDTILIFFLPTSESKSTVGADIIKNFCKLVVLFGCNDGVLISEKDLSPTAKRDLENTNIKSNSREGVYNVISYTDEKFINIVDHCLSPKVLKIFSGKELEDFETKNKVDSNLFPRMFVTDPVAKFYRARVGDVIMMKRKTGTTNTLIREQIVYRKVFYAIEKENKK